MKKSRSKSGFTLVELLLVVAAMGFLALTIGSILFYTWAGWEQAKESVSMQRDASLAMRVIAREIRESDPADISGGSSLTCTGGTFALAGSDFEYNNDPLVAGYARAFSATVNGREVTVTLRLGAGDDSSAVTARFYARN